MSTGDTVFQLQLVPKVSKIRMGKSGMISFVYLREGTYARG
jgi:hypothetical protein